MIVKSVLDPEFRRYGRVVQGLDVQPLLRALEKRAIA